MKFKIDFIVATDWMIRENERDISDSFPPVDIACAGIVVDEKDGADGHVAISTEVIPRGMTCRHVLSIPTKCIRERRTLLEVDLVTEDIID